MKIAERTAGPCKICKGRGRYQVKETYGDGDTLLTWYDCGTCKGTGTEPNPEGGDPYDIAGSLNGEEDDG